MSKSKIEQYIEQVEKDFVLNYEAETEKIIATKRESFKRETEELETKTVTKAKKEQANTLATTKQALEFEAKSKGEAQKSLMIEAIYHDVYENIKSLSGKALFEFVVGLLEKEQLKGHHRLLVKKGNFQKFYDALSSKTNCDLLNQKLSHVTFSLEVYDDAVEQGFIVEDQEFDLHFDFKSLVEKHKEVNAFKIYQQLFGDK